MNIFIKQADHGLAIFALAVILGVSTGISCASSRSYESANNSTNAAAQNKSASVDNESNIDKTAENKSAETARAKMIEVFDGRNSEVKPSKPSASETELIAKEVGVRAKEAFLKKRLEGLAGNFDEDFSVTDAAEGSFTKPKSSQKAYLYRYSYTNGVVIVENGIVVAHYSGDPGDYAFYFAVRSLADINRDGLSEIILFRNVEDNDDIFAYLFDFKKGNAEFLGETDFFSSNYEGGGDVESDKAKQKGYKVTVEPSASPKFFRESYQRTGSGKWSLAKKSESFSPDRKSDAKLTKID